MALFAVLLADKIIFSALFRGFLGPNGVIFSEKWFFLHDSGSFVAYRCEFWGKNKFFHPIPGVLEPRGMIFGDQMDFSTRFREFWSLEFGSWVTTLLICKLIRS